MKTSRGPNLETAFAALIGLLTSGIFLAAAFKQSSLSFPLDDPAWARLFTFLINVLLLTAIAGYIAALRANGSELRHALIVGALIELSYLWLASRPGIKPPSLTPLTFAAALKGVPSWYYVFPLLLLIPSSLVGGYLKKVGRSIKRSGWITIFGGLFAVWGAMDLYGSISDVIALLPSDGRVPSWTYERVITWVRTTIPFGYVIAGIGILLLRRWSRILILWLMSFLILLVLVELCNYFLFGDLHPAYVTMSIAISASMIAWYGFVLWFFSRHSVKAQFPNLNSFRHA